MSEHNSHGCRAQRALLRGLRPNAQTQKTVCTICPTRCIFCDIWKLATLIYSRAPASSKSPKPHNTGSSTSLSRQSSNSSTSSTDSASSANSFSYFGEWDWESSEKAIEAGFQTQRARLASIMSICTVEGAEECEGLRLAHDRCLMSVLDLLDKQSDLELKRAKAALDGSGSNGSSNSSSSAAVRKTIRRDARIVSRDQCSAQQRYMDQGGRRRSSCGDQGRRRGSSIAQQQGTSNFAMAR